MNGIHEVTGSTPVWSTITPCACADRGNTLDSNTLWTIGTAATVILSVAGAAIAVISVLSRLIADVRADMRAERAGGQAHRADSAGRSAFGEALRAGLPGGARAAGLSRRRAPADRRRPVPAAGRVAVRDCSGDAVALKSAAGDATWGLDSCVAVPSMLRFAVKRSLDGSRRAVRARSGRGYRGLSELLRASTRGVQHTVVPADNRDRRVRLHSRC